MRTGIIIALLAVMTPLAYADRTPKVAPDGRVTFTLHLDDEDIDEVHVIGSFNKNKSLLGSGLFSRQRKLEMERVGEEEEGNWRAVTEALPSDFYTYSFELDDDDENVIMDPMNPDKVRDIADSLSWFIVPGGMGDNFADSDVPHGNLETVWYPSKLPGMEKRRMKVYLPPDYNGNTTRRYPVLYLLHGSGGDEDAWSGCGRVVQILDNLISDGRCRPMVVVMPNGNDDLRSAPGSDPRNPDVKPSAKNLNSMMGGFESTFFQDVVSYVESGYRVKTDKKSRAVAGLSLGALHSMFLAMNNPDAFDYVGLFSPQTVNGINTKHGGKVKGLIESVTSVKDDFRGLFGKSTGGTPRVFTIYEDMDKKLADEFSNPPALYYIAIGSDDSLKGMTDEYRRLLDHNGYPYVYNESEGDHTWQNWRRYLVDFLPRLFVAH